MYSCYFGQDKKGFGQDRYIYGITDMTNKEFHCMYLNIKYQIQYGEDILAE